MSPGAIKKWFHIHKWTSLVSMVFLLMLCVTGLPLIFYHEIDHALGYSVDAPVIDDVGPRANIDDIVRDATSRRPDDKVQYLVGSADEPDLWFIRMAEDINALKASAFYIYDARSGDFLHEYPLGQGVMNIIFRLHYDMFAGIAGTLFLGFMGLVFVASLISGIVLYGPYMRKLRFGDIRRLRSKRIKWLDIHNFSGIVTFVWLFVVGLTGVINTLSIPIFGQWQASQLAEMVAAQPERRTDPSIIPSADSALRAVQAAAPGQHLGFMAFPGNHFASPTHFTAFMQGAESWQSKLLQPYLVDAYTSRIVAHRELPWYVNALLLSQPLHFGDYGGMPLKILWALLDILAILVLISGIYLWLKRRHTTFEAWFAAAREDGEPARTDMHNAPVAGNS